MKQAIFTKYFPPTDTKGSRVRAACYAGEKTLPWDSQLDSEANHRRVAEALMKRLGWWHTNALIGGSSHIRTIGYVWVQVPRVQ